MGRTTWLPYGAWYRRRCRLRRSPGQSAPIRYAHLSPDHLRSEVAKTEKPSGSIAPAVEAIPDLSNVFLRASSIHRAADPTLAANEA